MKITILKIHFEGITNEQSPYHVPGSKCKKNQRKTSHTHTKENSGKAHPRRKSILSEIRDCGFHLAFASMYIPKLKHSTKMGIIGTCPFLS